MKIIYDVPWCNGNTRVFGALIPGSNPGGTTFFILHVGEES